MDPLNFLFNISWTKPSWDLFIILFFLAVVFLYGFSMGKSRIIISLVSVYMALALVKHFPLPWGSEIAEIKIGQDFVVKIILFLAVVLLLFFLLSRSALQSSLGGESQGSWWQILIFSFFQVGLLMSVVLSYIPQEIINELTPNMREIFTTPNTQFIWILAPIIAMVLFGKSKS